MSGVTIQRAYVDKGFRGHDYRGSAQVMVSGRKQGLTPQMKRALRRRSAIEPMIAHTKNDGRLGRNHLFGHDGDAINAFLAAAGHNLRLILKLLLCQTSNLNTFLLEAGRFTNRVGSGRNGDRCTLRTGQSLLNHRIIGSCNP